MSESGIEKLRRELGPRLVREHQVAPSKGVSTGWAKLDGFLSWSGFPKSAVSLLVSETGGATTLWERSAARVTSQGQWVAWVNGSDARLTPWSLLHNGVDLSRLLSVSQPAGEKQFLWMMQELMSLSLFEMIGCELGRMKLREHQILKLKKLAMRYQTALVLFSPTLTISPFYSLILHFQGRDVTVRRALHRPTPHTFERRDLYADTLPLLAAGRRALCG